MEDYDYWSAFLRKGLMEFMLFYKIYSKNHTV